MCKLVERIVPARRNAGIRGSQVIDEQWASPVHHNGTESGHIVVDQTHPYARNEGEAPAPASTFRSIFIGPNGLRPGWGLFLFFTLIVVLGQITTFALHRLHSAPHLTAAQREAEAAKPQAPAKMLKQEGISFALVAIASWIMSRVERRPVGAYGFGGRRKVTRFSGGFAWGLLFLSVLVGALWKAGLLVFDRRLVFGADAIRYGAIWLLGFLFVGLLEEYLLRGYVQYTLSRGLASLYEMLFGVKDCKTPGFWTAAALLSFAFGAGHVANPGESPVGLISAGLIGLIFCLTLWRTGSLWWALGFHASWDWAQSFVFGVADSGTMVEGHLFATHPAGKVLWSGGTTGPEGSLLVLFVMAAVVGVIWMTLPRRPEWPIDAGGME